MTMNTRHKILSGLMGVLAALLFGQLGYAAYTVQATGNVPASATVGAIANLGVQARNISDNQQAPSVAFGSVTGLKLADQYLRITFQDNAPAWGMSIHTNNTGADALLRRESRAGGLLSTSTNTVVMPAGWQAYNDLQTTSPTVGDPSSDARWHFIKDINDADWLTAGGYRNVAYGGAGFANVVEPGTTGRPNTTGFFHVYPEVDGRGRAAGSYGGSMVLDLYTE